MRRESTVEQTFSQVYTMVNFCEICKRSLPEYQCMTCNKRFKQEKKLHRHQERRYPCGKIIKKYDNECEACHRVFEEFNCNACGAVFRYERWLIGHQNRKYPCVKTPKTYICDCGLHLSCYSALYRHKKKHCPLSKLSVQPIE